MTTTSLPSRTAAALDARHAAASMMLDRVQEALRQIRREQATVTVAAVARRALVSRTFLYQNAAARRLVREFVSADVDQRTQAQSKRAEQIEATWRERALNAEDGLTVANREILMQRNTIGELLGKIRDLEADIPEDGIQRIVTENTTLKQQIRQLTQDVKRFQDRLQAARDNNRFLDNRIAELEAQLGDTFNAIP